MDPRTLLRQLFDAAIASAQPARALAPHLAGLAESTRGRIRVLGAGKAAAAMAQALEQAWPGDPARLGGLVVTRYGYGAACRHIEVVEAAHPVPDAAGQQAAAQLMAEARALGRDDLALVLISGGGSALLPLPPDGATLADLQTLNRALLASGATIREMNTVRRHLSAIQGGRLAAAAHPARVLTLALSDVPGDDPVDIASGPTVADPSTVADAQAVIDRHRITLPPALAAALQRPEAESAKPGDPRLARAECRLIATPGQALQAAAAVARAAGITPLILGDALEGEAREVGTVLAGIARHAARQGQPATRPCVLLSGGETTVTLAQGLGGRGGRNVECLLASAMALQGETGVWALAGDTDGVDGAEEVAGAVIGPDTLDRAAALGLSARQALDRHDAHAFFEQLGDQVITGPTRTNVNDFRAFLVL
ncbi:glycerate kinase [Ideonella sp. 4Y16]|uniref:Glycerate kinase n=1 Tax=Ideonella alba TaxID=2824118 RepID=A0A940YDA7_9BURK|nr:glycerate kinase [Ideonella alba]MBQ0932063.1 glycerate kinase [Ideonella alba]MBQ0945655.1 glycerate kinase [Ideonella alba]